MLMTRSCLAVALSIVILCAATSAARANAVVTDGKFTNVYVFRPDHDGQTWDEHMLHHRSAGDASEFTRAKIDAFTAALMTVSWPSYFDSLSQYGIRPPQFG